MHRKIVSILKSAQKRLGILHDTSISNAANLEANDINLKKYITIQKFQENAHLSCYENGKLPTCLELINVNDIIKQELGNIPDDKELVSELQKLYCGDMRLEFSYLNDIEKHWLNKRFLDRESYYPISIEDQILYAQILKKSELFDNFLAVKFQSVKRYSGEGAESTLVFVHELLNHSSSINVNNVIISMAHRCRNNILTVLLKYPPILYFTKMKGKSEFPSDIKFGTGDTFSHYHISSQLEFSNGKSVQVSMIPNPSHLECNTPVGAGKTRSKMLFNNEGEYNSNREISCLGLFVHGDASVCGQGIIPETLVMTTSPNFKINGSIHLVINNGLGFTTETPYGLNHVTDIGKVVNCPVIHVNAFNVHEVSRAAKLALDYRQKFHKDIFINFICYRKWGHNELDDPTITQPLMYEKINSFKSIPETYLNDFKTVNPDYDSKVTEEVNLWKQKLNEDLLNFENYQPPLISFKSQWEKQKLLEETVDTLGLYNTGVKENILQKVGQFSVFIKPDLNVHSNVFKSHIQKRIEKLENKDFSIKNIDWATAEAFAIGSLLSEGFNCRISGQDVGRGTFNHRHFTLTDQTTGEITVPFNDCDSRKDFPTYGLLEVANSILSEEAVLGFEFGMALDNPDNLIIWEAQFGDFFNGAQIIIDTYIGSSETKWLLQNGLVMLLPHGYDGAGPEHSSCKIERFLQLTDSSEIKPDSDAVNMCIANPTTPAQYFHLLRRQIHRPFRKPLIVIAPKLILRSPLAVSSLNEMKEGTYFQHILPFNNKGQNDNLVKQVILCSGKYYYTLLQHLNSLDAKIQAQYTILRVEQLVPFPIVELSEELKRYKNAKAFIWCQEEPRNMGAWTFVEPRIRNMLGINLKYVGRKELATPAVGIGELFKQESAMILKETFSANN